MLNMSRDILRLVHLLIVERFVISDYFKFRMTWATRASLFIDDNQHMRSSLSFGNVLQARERLTRGKWTREKKLEIIPTTIIYDSVFGTENNFNVQLNDKKQQFFHSNHIKWQVSSIE